MSHTYFFITLYPAVREPSFEAYPEWLAEMGTLWEINMTEIPQMRADQYCLRGSKLYALAAVSGDVAEAEPLLSQAISRFAAECHFTDHRPDNIRQVWGSTRKIRRLMNREELNSTRDFIVQCILKAEFTHPVGDEL